MEKMKWIFHKYKKMKKILKIILTDADMSDIFTSSNKTDEINFTYKDVWF